MRIQRSILNFSTLILYNFSVLIISFLTTPLILKWLGPERLGAFRMAADWQGYLMLLELGIGNALLPLFARVAENLKKAEETLIIGVRAYSAITLSMIAFGMLGYFFLPRLIPVHADLQADVRMAWLVAIAGSLLMPFVPLKLFMDARQRGYWVNALQFLQFACLTLVSLLLAYEGWGVTGQFIALVASGIPVYVALVFWSTRYFKKFWRHLFTLRSNPDIKGQLWHLNQAHLVLNICGRVGLLTDNIIIGIFLGPTLVVPFMMTQKLALMAQSQIQGVGNATWAALAELHAQNEHEIFKARLLELTKLTLTLGLAILVPIALLNGPFVTLWVGGDYYVGRLLTLLACLNALFVSLVSIWGWSFTATGQAPKLMKISIAATIVNATVSIVGTWKIGIVGPLLGTVANFVLVSGWGFPLLMRKTFGISIRQMAWTCLPAVVAGVLYYAVMTYVIQRFTITTWIGLITFGFVTSAAFGLICWFLVLDRTERNGWGSRLKIALGKRLNR